MLGPTKHRDLDRPAVVSLEHLVPQDHFYCRLDATLSEISRVLRPGGRYLNLATISVQCPSLRKQYESRHLRSLGYVALNHRQSQATVLLHCHYLRQIRRD